ncbi:serine hydroxymethyltransferase [Buchnera aphidicola]|uniref:serine hydroxymethyltransferase n=1 Tax=Buchnera aphidicola TaxID=9 RepID=UPI003463A0C2
MIKKKKNFFFKDYKLWNLIKKEKIRQNSCINLIASENYTSLEIMKAQGSCLTNKYAEGYPNNRYYAGCKYIDKIENLAIKRAKKLFKADYANVQPHSGSQANFSVYQALLNPGDKILGMKLSHGGHLTHGSSVNFSGKIYNPIFYELDKNGKIDYNFINFLAKKHKPKIIIGGFSSYSGLCNWKYFRKIADKINAYLIVDMSHISGLVAAGLHSNPLKYAHVVTSTTHKTLAGPRGGMILSNEKNKVLYSKLDKSVFPGTQGGPLVHIIAAKAIAFKNANNIKFVNYQIQVLKNSKTMCKYFIKNGFTIVSNETKNHLFLIDLSKKNINGKEAEKLLEKSNIIVNKNSVPNDLQNPSITSGIRIGTAAITKRGFKKLEVKKICSWIVYLLNNDKKNVNYLKIKRKVFNLCNHFPIKK